MFGGGYIEQIFIYLLVLAALVGIVHIGHSNLASVNVATPSPPASDLIIDVKDAANTTEPVYYTKAELEDNFVELFAVEKLQNALGLLTSGACLTDDRLFTWYNKDKSVIRENSIERINPLIRSFVAPYALFWLRWSIVWIGADTLVDVMSEKGISEKITSLEFKELDELHKKQNSKIEELWGPYSAPEADREYLRRVLRKVVVDKPGRELLKEVVKSGTDAVDKAIETKTNVFYAACDESTNLVLDSARKEPISREVVGKVTKDIWHRVTFDGILCSDEDPDSKERYTCFEQELSKRLNKSFEEVLQRVEKLSGNSTLN